MVVFLFNCAVASTLRTLNSEEEPNLDPIFTMTLHIKEIQMVMGLMLQVKPITNNMADRNS